MKNKIKILSAVILAFCTAGAVFSGCGKTETISSTAEPSDTAAETYAEPTSGITVYSDENYTYHSVVYDDRTASDSKNIGGYAYASTSEFVPITIATEPRATVIAKTSAAATTHKTEATTKRVSSGSTEKIDEISKGIGVITKTTPVLPGNTATITVLGNPNKSYSIEFYEEGSTPSVTSGLENKTANQAGFVSWTFTVSPLCSAGNKKIIIKEIGSDNYIQTSITIK